MRPAASVWAAGAAALVLYATLFAGAYEIRILTVAGIYALAVLGYQIVFGLAGALSLAQGAFFGLGAYAAAILSTRLGLPFEAGLAAAILVPTALAALVAVPVLRLESHYFALATLGVAQVVLLAAVNWQSLTGGANGLAGIPPAAVLGVEIGRGLPMLALVWTIAGAAALLAWRWLGGLTALGFRLAREHPAAAAAAGLDVGGMRFRAFLASAACGGAAGALHAHLTRVVSPESAGFEVMVACLTMAVIGGRGRIAGAFLGALLLIHVPEWFRFLDRYYLIAYGAAALAVVVLAPSGLAGLVDRAAARLWPRPRSAPPAPLPLAPPRSSAGTAILVARGMAKAFGGVRAVDRVDLDLRAGEILGIIGPNGAGKTTLLNLLSGHERADSGTVRLVAGTSPGRAHARARAGLARTFQSPQLMAGESLLDNVALGAAAGSASAQAARGRALSALAAVGLEDRAAAAASALAPAEMRLAEIARALAAGPSALLLDEPAAGLTPGEQQALADRLRGLAKAGLAVMVVEHNMPFLMPLADRVVCLVEGRVVADGPPDAVRRHPQVTAAYLGTEAA